MATFPTPRLEWESDSSIREVSLERADEKQMPARDRTCPKKVRMGRAANGWRRSRGPRLRREQVSSGTGERLRREQVNSRAGERVSEGAAGPLFD